MKINLAVGAVCLLAIIGLLFSPQYLSNRQRAATLSDAFGISDRSEDAYRANNLGVAQLEQFNYREAADEFRKALALDPKLKLAQINLAIALFNAQEIETSRDEAEKALKIAPEILQTHFILGLIARNQNRAEDALGFFQNVLAVDPLDVGANINIGQIYTQQRRYAEAITVFRRAYDAEPYNSTAIYNLATALIRDNKREEGQQLIERFQALRQSGAATSIGQSYLEQGRYAEALVSTGAEPELVDHSTPAASFQNTEIGLPKAAAVARRSVRTRTPLSTSTVGAAVLFDFDNDNDLDLLQITGVTLKARLYRNEAGRFSDVSAASGDLQKISGLSVSGIVAGDFDNDTFDDLLAFGNGRLALLRGDGKGNFTNVTAAAKLAEQSITSASGAFVDADHDGDLDIFLGGSATARRPTTTNKLLRNNGDGTFADVSADAKIGVPARAVAVVPTDYDNRRDVDLLVLNYGKTPSLFQNLRNGSFRDAAAGVGLNQPGKWTCAAAGDFNKDTFVDFFFGREGQRGILAVSDGRGKFILKEAAAGTENAVSAQFLDYDNDGLLDLIASTSSGFIVSRNLGDRWSESDSRAFPKSDQLAGSLRFISGDIDRDGDVDLLTIARNGSLNFLRNVGGESGGSEIVSLKGRVSNRAGIGSKVDMRSGSLTQKLESYSASPMPAPSDLHFGLGKRRRPDAVRIIWPSGVIQAEVDFPRPAESRLAFQPLKIEELDRKPSSCPYLYTWNGEKFEFITDFLGGGEMGNWMEQGAYHFPDPDEYVRVPSEMLKPKDGKYEIRVTNELEEVLFIDHLKLIAVEHNADTEIYPNEGLGIPNAGKQLLHTTSGEHAPLSALDNDGNDVLPKILSLDRQFYDSFKSLNIRGYAETHSLTLNLDDKKGHKGRTLLLLTGWTDYAFSSDNVAASQSGRSLFFPKLQVKDSKGEWQTVVDSIGISVGRPQTVVVDLTGKFLSDSREVRIVTNVKTYWDKITVDTSNQNWVTTTEIAPARADLRERGFSDESRFGGMIVPSYERVLNDGRWKYFSGKFTRTGDVRPLLDGVDDVFVISRTGDELVLSFEALADPPSGRKYTFLLYASGYSKEMDINSGSPDAVLPLPFSGMTKYPYGADERFPMDARKQQVYDEYTTRFVKGILPRIETSLLR